MSEIMQVPYNIPGSQQWEWINIYTRLSQERIIFVNSSITSGMANSIVSSLLYLDSEDNNKPIFIYINSLGDPVDAGLTNISAGMMSISSGLAIYDTMQSIKSDIYTICLGQATGMAALLLAAGKKGQRASLPNASIVLEHPRMGARGQASDLEINAQEVLNKRRLIMEIFARHTNHSVEKLEKDSERAFYLTPQAAKEYGIIDRVLESNKVSRNS
jgi:ATP-dependent Clp protease, protease subunit